MNSESAQQPNGNADIENGGSRLPDRTKQRGIIYFRSIKPNDRKVIQELHEQWFPVDYTSDFFDGLCNSSVMPSTREPLYSCLACLKEVSDDDFESLRNKQMKGCIKDGGLSFLLGRRKQSLSEYVYLDEYGECILWEADNDTLPSDETNDDVTNGSESNGHFDGSARASQQSRLATGLPTKNYCQLTTEESERAKIVNFYNKLNEGSNLQTSSSNTNRNKTYHNEEGERIVGCLIGTFLSSSRLSAKHESEERDETSALLVPDPEIYPRMFYIMTLGTVPEFRRVGLGSILVNRVVEMIEARPEVGTLYLHVITYNKGGVLLMLSLPFLNHEKANVSFYFFSNETV